MTPRVHGNGFIQLDLTETTRLHVWGDPRIPRQRVMTPIHSHVFDFTSTVYKGRLIHIEYNVVSSETGTFQMYQVNPTDNDNTILVNTGYYYNIIPYHTKVIEKGQSYSFTANRFHENLAAEPTVTIMEKYGSTLAENPNGPRPNVLAPRNIEPDNTFDRYHDESLLWSIINNNVPVDLFNKCIDDYYQTRTL